MLGTIQVDLTNVPSDYTYGLILYDKNREIASLDVQGKGDKRLQGFYLIPTAGGRFRTPAPPPPRC